jgi:hypothetical protein
VNNLRKTGKEKFDIPIEEIHITSFDFTKEVMNPITRNTPMITKIAPIIIAIVLIKYLPRISKKLIIFSTTVWG